MIARFLPAFLAGALFLAAGIPDARAAIFAVDLSPGAGLALNLGANPYTRDHAIGLAALNAVGQPASPATGGEIGAGITYNDTSNALLVNIGYGSDFGFTDLMGTFSTAHIHGAVPVQFPSANIGAGIQVGAPFTALHTPGSSAMTGSFVGEVTLSAAQETMLFDNELYVNIHSSFAGGGEIRGQLVVVPEPNTAFLVAIAASALLLPFRRRRR